LKKKKEQNKTNCSSSILASLPKELYFTGERVRSNLARFVVIIWVFVVLIVTQSYTANLASQMTVKQLQPAVRDVNQLRENGELVGYQHGSYMYEFLKGMGFDDSKLKVYRNAEECDQLLKLGSQNGGISAAFDEIPYTNVILTEYRSKYTTIGSTYRTEGFGFVSKVSPLLIMYCLLFLYSIFLVLLPLLLGL
jgi:ionotropic glutamate receptor